MSTVRGRWTIAIILLVAIGMGAASWPLLRLRRKNELHRAGALIETLKAACEQYRSRHGAYPPDLGAVTSPKIPLLDAWGRPVYYRVSGNSFELWSTGPDESDPADDVR